VAASQLAFAAMLVAPEPGQKIIRFFSRKKAVISRLTRDSVVSRIGALVLKILPIALIHKNFMYIKNIQLKLSL